MTVEVKDKDVFGSDDFMGQAVLTLSDFADGKEHTVVELLRDEVLITRTLLMMTSILKQMCFCSCRTTSSCQMTIEAK